jgi:hypothetical protein
LLHADACGRIHLARWLPPGWGRLPHPRQCIGKEGSSTQIGAARGDVSELGDYPSAGSSTEDLGGDPKRIRECRHSGFSAMADQLERAAGGIAKILSFQVRTMMRRSAWCRMR